MDPEPNPQFLRRAIALATENVEQRKGGPFGAVIVQKGRIVGEGVNSVTARNDPTAHAEILAIRAAADKLNSFVLSGCQLYTSCEPCPMCLAAAYWARVDAIYFGAGAEDAARSGFNDAYLYEQIRRTILDRELPAQQLLREEALGSFDAWNASPTKAKY